MSNTKKRKVNKLLPAVAMLAVSAISLSTATYAWFTMNKEVEVTGLQMSATAGDSLEITLGKLGDYGKAAAISSDTRSACGSEKDLGWTRSVAIDEYYHLISKLKPASSDTALSMYLVEEEKVYAGGRAVKADSTVTAADNDDMSGIKLDATYNTKNLTNWKDGTDVATGYHPGYYVDIPMWIRSGNETGANVNAWVTITDGKDNVASELINAVRVAIIPIASTTKLSDAKNLGYEDSVTRTLNTSTKVDAKTSPVIFGLTYNTYEKDNKVFGEAGTYSEVFRDTSITTALSKKPTTYTGGTAVFKMPAATQDDYAAVLVVARVWLEGESEYCNDATAGQDWNIDFHFALDSDTGDLNDYQAPTTTTGG